MNNFVIKGNSLKYLKIFIIVFLVSYCSFFIPQAVFSQDGSLPTLFGQSRIVNLPPYSSVNVGLIRSKLDTDHDGISDEDEIRFGLNPSDPSDVDLDSDGDGLRNGDEITLGTNPTLADTDGDGVSDGEEVRLGFDPLDPTSTPPMGVTLTSIQVNPSIIGIAINSITGVRPVQLTVTGTLSDNTTIDLTNNPATIYQSLNTNIAVVDSLGSVLVVAAGSTVVTVRNGNLTAQVPVFSSAFTPQNLSSLQMPGFANSVDVKDNYAYVACGVAGLRIVDVANPREPFIAASLALEGSANDIKIAGNFAYIVSSFGGLHIVDVSDPLNPSLLNSVQLNEAIDLAVKGNYAYIAAGAEGFKIIDISDPFNASVVASLSIPADKFAEGIDVDPTRDVVILLFSDTNLASGVLQTIDVSNANSPVFRGQVTFLGQHVKDVAINGNLAYVATNVFNNNTNSLSVVNITNINAPGLVSSAGISRGSTDVKVKNGIAFVPSDTFGVAAMPLFSLNTPTNPVPLGSLIFTSGAQYIYGKSVTVTDSLVFSTAGADRNIQNGIIGNSALLIGQYNLLPVTGTPPSVNIISPIDATTVVVQDPPITIKAVVNDVPIAGVEFRANGVVISTDATAPYEAIFNVPSSPGNVIFEARAIDIGGNIGISSPVTIQVVSTDPFTTVIGRVVDIQGNSISEASVTLENSTLTTITDFNGEFTFTNVATIPFGVRVTVSANDINERTGRSFAVPTVRGGITDIGSVTLVDRKITTLPTTPIAFGVGEYDGNSVSDLFVGFSDRQSFVYMSDGQGLFTPNTNFVLPFAAVKSGTSADVNNDGSSDVIAQALNEVGNATIVLSDGNGSNGNTSMLATGLNAESEIIVEGKDDVGRQVLAFLSRTGATQLTVRIADDNGVFGSTITIPIPANTIVRTLALADVTRDGLVDVIASRLDTGSAGTVLVFPRISETTFGTVVESDIDLRTTAQGEGIIDYVVADFNFDVNKDIAVLGDGKVRIYRGSQIGKFTPFKEIELLPNSIAIGIASGILGTQSFGELAVLTKDMSNPELRTLAIYGRVSFSSEVLSASSNYTMQSSSVGDARVAIGTFGGIGFNSDVVVVEGDKISSFLNLGPGDVSTKVYWPCFLETKVRLK